MPSPNNFAIIAAAGSRKTQFIVEQALAEPNNRILITTYTNENKRQITSRLAHLNGVAPSNVTVAGWFTFLINECARPYQRAVIDQPNLIGALNFDGERNRYTPRSNARSFFLDSSYNMYRDTVSRFVCDAERATGGLVTKRLSEMLDHIYVDELQDLVGYDLEFLDLLMDSSVDLTIVGDPRQCTYSTNDSPKYKKYRGAGLLDWFSERKTKCALETRQECFRCNQAICDFADALYPNLPPTTSRNTDVTGHDGIVFVRSSEVLNYVREHSPVVLRDNKKVDTLGLPAINFGVSKGSTYGRVLIFPTNPMLKYLASKDLKVVGSKDRLYVAVTRARHSVAFVVPDYGRFQIDNLTIHDWGRASRQN